MSPIPRRTFLQDSLALAVACTGTSTFSLPITANLFSDDPHVTFPASPRDRIAVSSYPFREFIVGGHHVDSAPPAKMPLRDFPAHVLAKFNIRKVEPWSRHFLSLDPGYVDEIRNTASKAGVAFANIAADGDHSLYSPDAAERDRAIEFGKAWIGVAARLGSSSVRINLATAKNVKTDGELVAEGLKPIAEHAASKNVVVHLENDNPVSEDPFFIVSVIDRVKSPWLHALPDFGNSLAALPAEDAYRGLDQMFAHAYAISHVKETITTRSNAVAHVDLARSFSLAAKHGYKGNFSMEFDSEGDPYEGTAKLIAATIKNLS
jgi:sugar phosphate isomerase/epimerase